MPLPDIPLFRPDATSLERDALGRVLASGWWGLGPETARFEEEFAGYVQAASGGPEAAPLHPVATSSASMALEIAARCLSPRPARVITTPLTFVSTASAMMHAGHQVELCDIDDETLSLDWAQAAERAGRGGCPCIVVPVWYAGTVTPPPAGLPEGTVILEDCAHAAGSRGAGAHGSASAWSFHAVKNLAAGDGGMILLRDGEAAARARRLRWCGISKSTHDRVTQQGYGWDYTVSEDGEKAHMNDVTAAIARAQLQRLDAGNARRRAIARAYDAALAGLDWVRRPALSAGSAQHMYVIRVPAGSRAALIAHMISLGVSAGVHYRPLYHHAALFPGAPALPVAERAWQELVTIPLFPSMTQQDTSRVIDAIGSFRPRAA